MPKVYNLRDGKAVPPEAIYVGRPTKWGNPFVLHRDGSRQEVIDKYEGWLYTSNMIHQIGELRGKDLTCWCAPKPCHADVLLRLANANLEM